MKPDPIFARVFGKLYGVPAWNVRRGLGSFITLEFGQPRLDIHEPTHVEQPVSPRVRRRLAQRRIFVHGEWHLWVYCCAWCVFDGAEKVVGHWDSSKARIDRVAAFLAGQKLVAASLESPGNRTTFGFDLGGRLETRPYDRRSEQWMLFAPNGKVLTLRADKRYSYHSSRSARRHEWRPTATPVS